MMRLFDTHAHLLSERFDADREALISELPSRGLAGCIEVGTDLEFSDRAQRLAEQTDYIWAAVGVHPHDSADAPEDYIERLMEIAARQVVAIGEIGLDYHYDFSPGMCSGGCLAAAGRWRFDFPVIIHMREATQDTLAMLREHGDKGVMHCFSGSAETAEICVGMGLYVSFTGSVTFKNARKVVEAVAAVPPGG